VKRKAVLRVQPDVQRFSTARRRPELLVYPQKRADEKAHVATEKKRG